jgi:membrane protein
MASLWAILAATRRRMGGRTTFRLAAGAAFQALLSLFPTLTAVVSLYGLVADPNMVLLWFYLTAYVIPRRGRKLNAEIERQTTRAK